MVFHHEWCRIVTETDNMWFSLLTMNVQPLHIDAQYAAKSESGKPLVNSLFTLGLMIGKSRPNQGIVNFLTNQDGIVVATCERAALMRKRPAERV